MLVMDFGSEDGTKDILGSRYWSSFISLVPFPGFDELDSSNLFLKYAKREFPTGTYCLFCDPDEFLVTPSMSVSDVLWSDPPEKVPAYKIPRYNVTASLKSAREDQSSLTPLGELKLRIDETVSRRPLEEIDQEKLEPPWIYTWMPGKVFVHLDSVRVIGIGDHNAHCYQGEQTEAESGIYFLHYPIRTWLEFKAKIEMAKIHFSSNPQLSQEFGWHVRRWIRLSSEQKLYGEYLSQFVKETDLASAVQLGLLSLDEKVRTFGKPGSFDDKTNSDYCNENMPKMN
jgi:hypothetical protein